MSGVISRSLALVQNAGLKGIVAGEQDGRDALLCNGKPILENIGSERALLHCSASAKRVLLQTDPVTYSDLPSHPSTDVYVDMQRISDEELLIHLEQAANECAAGKG